jgi:hypothetical protein
MDLSDGMALFLLADFSSLMNFMSTIFCVLGKGFGLTFFDHNLLQSIISIKQSDGFKKSFSETMIFST